MTRIQTARHATIIVAPQQSMPTHQNKATTHRIPLPHAASHPRSEHPSPSSPELTHMEPHCCHTHTAHVSSSPTGRRAIPSVCVGCGTRLVFKPQIPPGGAPHDVACTTTNNLNHWWKKFQGISQAALASQSLKLTEPPCSERHFSARNAAMRPPGCITHNSRPSPAATASTQDSSARAASPYNMHCTHSSYTARRLGPRRPSRARKKIANAIGDHETHFLCP